MVLTAAHVHPLHDSGLHTGIDVAGEGVEGLVIVVVGVERPVAEIVGAQRDCSVAGVGWVAGLKGRRTLGLAREVVGCHGATLPCRSMPPKTYTTDALQARTLKRGERVRLVADLPGVASGAQGKVAMANGFTWNRYWVRFVDGPVVGHIDHGDLVRTKDYERYLVARHREAEEAERAAQQAAENTASPADDGPAGPSTADAAAAEAVVNGVAVPAFLLERSAEARARLGA